MGYIIGLVIIVILVPLIIMLVRGTRSSGVRGTPKQVMRQKPAADEPSPAGGTVNRGTEQAQRKTPPA